MNVRRAHQRIGGATLVEALVAIFVVGLGLLSILALFPLGVLQMAQALQDERSAQAAAQASAIAELGDVRHESALSQSLQGSSDPFRDPAPGEIPPAEPDGPGYPVLVDPIGFHAGGPGGDRFVAELFQLPRRTLSFVADLPPGSPPSALQRNIQRWCVLLDDVAFDPAGLPTLSQGAVMREGRYSWAYLLRKPKLADPTVVDLSVVVSSQRPLWSAGGLRGETAFDAYGGVEGSTRVTIVPTAGKSAELRRGWWILDATQELGNQGKTGWCHGIFYRVVDYSLLSGGELELELETPLRMPIAPESGKRVPKVVVFDRVVEVIEKGPGRVP